MDVKHMLGGEFSNIARMLNTAVHLDDQMMYKRTLSRLNGMKNVAIICGYRVTFYFDDSAGYYARILSIRINNSEFFPGEEVE